MGGGVSNTKHYNMFVNSEIVDGSKYLCGDAQFRNIFIDYVRSGQWAERLASITQDKNCFEGGSVVSLSLPDKLWVNYNLTDDMINSFADVPTRGKLSRSPRMVISSRTIHTESFQIANCSGFSADELTSIMFCILYPLFASTSDDEDTTKLCNNSLSDIYSDDGQPQPQRQRSLEILSNCSDYKSELEMHDFLENPEWVFTTSNTFDSFPLSISICDTSKTGCPLVYANKAFAALSGYSQQELLAGGRGLDILHGPATEAPQLSLLQQAVATGRAAKVGVTHYTKKQKAFLDLVAVRPSAHYSVAVHFSTCNGCPLEDMKMVDDLLLLLFCVLETPCKKAATSGSTFLNIPSIKSNMGLKTSSSVNSLKSLTHLLGVGGTYNNTNTNTNNNINISSNNISNSTQHLAALSITVDGPQPLMF